MNFFCEVKELKNALNKLVGVVSLDKTQSVLDHIKIVTEDKAVKLIATDTEIQIEKIINAKINKDGEGLVVGKKFCEFVSKLTCEQVEITQDEPGSLKIKYDDSETILPSADVNKFPKLIEISSNEKFDIKMSDLKELIEKVDFSLSTESNRPVLNGCLFEIENGKIKAVALDGYRIAIATCEIKNKEINKKILIHGRQLKEIKKILDSNDEEITFIISSDKICIDLLHTKIISQLMREEFINYKNVIPEAKATEIIVQKKEFENTIQRVEVINRDVRNNDVCLTVKEQHLGISAQSLYGTINEKLPVSVTGIDQKVNLSIRFIIDCLKVIKEEELIIGIATSTKPILIRNKENTWNYIIVPIMKK